MSTDKHVKHSYGRGPFILPQIIRFADELASNAIKLNDTVIDATMGNGHDTIKLAQWVGPNGLVHAFDIQPQALQRTQERLQEHGLVERCKLHLCGHQFMTDTVNEEVAVVLFNLGYLPGQDKLITTQIDTTLEAIEQALALLKESGVLIIVVYPGHEQGRIEQETLDQWVKQVDTRLYRSLRYQFENTAAPAPYVLAVEKLKTS
ncbi:MAG: methyltransferase domain-containing protein [Alcaligenaceae bacterium]|jgi:16S rRNA C1402 N4-methylase RsmH|nr:methyltransferase domain-containing protein [Alcaligenaceae bacterium]